MTQPALTCDSLSCRRSQWASGTSSVIDDITLSFDAGTLTVFQGPDGCGKGLLLNVLGLLEPPDAGAIHVVGHAVNELAEEDSRQLRNEAFGFLFDHPCLLPSFSVAENVAMPLFRICGGDARAARARTMEVLDFCGISEFECTLAGRLEPAAQRRAALARALVHRPGILIAISPKGSDDLLPIIRRAIDEHSLCALWAGHGSDELRHHATRLIEMHEGRIQEDVRP